MPHAAIQLTPATRPAYTHAQIEAVIARSKSNLELWVSKNDRTRAADHRYVRTSAISYLDWLAGHPEFDDAPADLDDALEPVFCGYSDLLGVSL